MPGIGLLHEWLSDACPSIHRARLSALVKVVHGLLVGGRLTLTELGRRLPTTAFVKHNIKCVDRLLGTAQLHTNVLLSIERSRGGHRPKLPAPSSSSTGRIVSRVTSI